MWKVTFTYIFFYRRLLSFLMIYWLNQYWSIFIDHCYSTLKVKVLKAFCKHVLMCDVATIDLSMVIIGALQDPIGQTQGLRAESGLSYYFIWAISTEFA